MDEEVTGEELTLEDKLAWRRKISSVDASLKSALETSAGQKKGRMPMLSRNKKPAAPEEAEAETKPEGRTSRRLRFGTHNATT